MTYVMQQSVRFAHCDPAGIVFYPRYFEMLNAAMEDYFSQVVGVDFASMHLKRRLGIPTVKLDTEFLAPSRLGDRLDFEVTIEDSGRSSAGVLVEISCAGELRVRVKLVLVCLDLDSGRPVPWPADMRPTHASAA